MNDDAKEVRRLRRGVPWTYAVGVAAGFVGGQLVRDWRWALGICAVLFAQTAIVSIIEQRRAP